jgi:hypothetical protein
MHWNSFPNEICSFGGGSPRLKDSLTISDEMKDVKLNGDSEMVMDCEVDWPGSGPIRVQGFQAWTRTKPKCSIRADW